MSKDLRNIVLATKRQILALNPETGKILTVKPGDDRKILSAYACNNGIFHVSPNNQAVTVYDSISGHSVHTISLAEVARLLLSKTPNRKYAMELLDMVAENLENGSLVREDESLQYHIPIGPETTVNFTVFQKLSGHVEPSGLLKVGEKSVIYSGRHIATLKPANYGGRIAYAHEVGANELSREFRKKNREAFEANKDFFTK